MSNQMSQHTPGPWRYYTKPQPNGCPIIGTRGLMVAMLAHSINHQDQIEEALANARLIAAAPELLDIATEIMSIGDSLVRDIYGSEFLESIKQAIAKATGATK